jgi:hypothetical protein
LEVDLSEELTHQQVMEILGAKSAEAYGSLISSMKAQETDVILVNKEDLFILLAEVMVNAGMEVQLGAAQAFVDSVKRMAGEGDSISSRKVRALVMAMEHFMLDMNDGTEVASSDGPDRRPGERSEDSADGGGRHVHTGEDCCPNDPF